MSEEKTKYMRIRLVCNGGQCIKAWLAIPLAEVVGTYSTSGEMVYFKKRMALLKCDGDNIKIREVIYLQINKIPVGYTPIDPNHGEGDPVA